MNAEQYNKWSKPLRENPQVARIIVLANKGITCIYYVAYPLLIAWLFLSQNALAWKALVFPMLGFMTVTLMRKAINKARPYEALTIQPIISKDTKGKSFPSRHTYSAFAIAATIFAWHAHVGIAFFIVACCLACIRILGGVHYPSDVLAGAALGIAFCLLELVF